MRYYKVKEIFRTLQGEGYWVGKPAIFIRFSGCNLWSGKEADRSTAACQFCDTDFVGGERMTATEICEAASSLWGKEHREQRFCVLTGGEPAIQVDYQLIATLKRFEFFIAIETNGTKRINEIVDWITVSPKANSLPLVQQKGDEIKLVHPQIGVDPRQFDDLDFSHRFLQPMDGVDAEANTKSAIDYCLSNPKWRLSVQTHKILGIP